MLNKRFLDAEWLIPHDILIAGDGGVGNGLAMHLASIGHNIYLYDFDTVEEYNCIPQNFKLSQIGMAKVEATYQNIKDYCGTNDNVEIFNKKYDNVAAPIMITAIDSMIGRKQVFESFKNDEDAELFFDIRLAAEDFQLYTVTKDNVEQYEKTLFLDSDVEEGSCTYKQTKHVAGVSHGFLVSILNNYIVNKEIGTELYHIPFYIEWNAKSFTYDYAINPML